MEVAQRDFGPVSPHYGRRYSVGGDSVLVVFVVLSASLELFPICLLNPWLPACDISSCYSGFCSGLLLLG